jgi:DNA polymerase III subunit delta
MPARAKGRGRDPEAEIREAVATIQGGASPRACLVCGDDDYLRGAAARELGEALLPEADRNAFNFRTLDGEREDIGEIVAAMRTYSLFGGPTVLWVERTRLLVSRLNAEEVLAKAAATWTDADRRDNERGRSRAAHDVLKVLAVRRLGLDAIDPENLDGALDEVLEGQDAGAAGWLHQVYEYCMRRGLAPAGSGGEAHLIEALEEGWPEGNTLVLVAASCDRRLRLFKAFRAHGLVVDVAVSSSGGRSAEDAARRRLQGMAQAEGAELTPGARALLEKKVGFDLSRLHQEISKLATYVGAEGPVTEVAVEEVVGWTREEGQWELSNAIQERDRGRALRTLRRMLEHGETPIRVFFQVAAKVRSLLLARACIEGPLASVWRPGLDESGYRNRIRPRVEELLSAEDDTWGSVLRVHPWALFKSLEATERYGRGELLRAHEGLYETNWRLVTGQGAPAALLEQLVHGLTTKRASSTRPGPGATL